MTPPIMEGWEVPTNKVKMYDGLMNNVPIGDPIITSPCQRAKSGAARSPVNGFLVISENGFAQRNLAVSPGILITVALDGVREATGIKDKWVRWHDVANIIPKKPGQVQVVLKARKKGAIVLNKKGNYKTKKWKLTINKHKDEKKDHFRERKASFFKIVSEIYNRNRVEIDPPTSDSKM